MTIKKRTTSGFYFDSPKGERGLIISYNKMTRPTTSMKAGPQNRLNSQKLNKERRLAYGIFLELLR